MLRFSIFTFLVPKPSCSHTLASHHLLHYLYQGSSEALSFPQKIMCQGWYGFSSHVIPFPWNLSKFVEENRCMFYAQAFGIYQKEYSMTVVCQNYADQRSILLGQGKHYMQDSFIIVAIWGFFQTPGELFWLISYLIERAMCSQPHITDVLDISFNL